MADHSIDRRDRSLDTPTGAMRRVRRIGARPAVQVPEGFRHPLAPSVSSTPPTLLPLIGVNDDVLPAFERTLHPIAVRAQDGDWAARDALYAAFEAKLMRIARRIKPPFAPTGSQGLWEFDDVTQEAWLVFAAVIASWSPEIPFGRYVLAHFPWRLRDAVYRGVGKRNVPPRSFGVPIDDDAAFADHAAPGAEQRATIEVLAGSFESPLDQVLRLHILENLTLRETSERLGVSRRSTTRYWQTILLRLRASPWIA